MERLRLSCHPSAAPLVPVSAAQAYVSGMLFGLGVFLSFYMLTLLIACWESWR